MTKNNDPQKTQQIINLLKVILEQNYFTFQEQIFQPTQCVAMGSPISGFESEIFLQQHEEIHLKHILDSKKIAYYARYVDDILIIYDSAQTNKKDIDTYINRILKFLEILNSFPFPSLCHEMYPMALTMSVPIVHLELQTMQWLYTYAMKYTVFAYEMICVTKRCVMFNTYARNLTSTME
jgi:hypothetical protein